MKFKDLENAVSFETVLVRPNGEERIFIGVNNGFLYYCAPSGENPWAVREHYFLVGWTIKPTKKTRTFYEWINKRGDLQAALLTKDFHSISNLDAQHVIQFLEWTGREFEIEVDW